jgi:hypothetical protein
MIMNAKPILFAAVALVSVISVPLPGMAQSVSQQRACRNYVANAPGFRNVSFSDIEVLPGEDGGRRGEATVYWRLRGQRASGSCLVSRSGQILRFDGDRGRDDDYYVRNPRLTYRNRQVEYRWGDEVRRPYGARVNANVTLADHPDRDDKRDVADVRDRERVIIFRTYRDRRGTTWLLVQGSRGQEGWINERRLY